MGKLTAYCREGCSYSNNTKQKLLTLQQYIQISNHTNLFLKINTVKNEEPEKNKIKEKLKPIINNYGTWPIVIYTSTKGEEFLIGGDSDLNDIINFCMNFNKVTTIDELFRIISERSIEYTNSKLNGEGERRLICNLLLIGNKIKLN